MGKVVCHWEDIRHSAIDSTAEVLQKPNLYLTAIATAESFSYFISDARGNTIATRGISVLRKYHFFDRPLGYLEDLIGQDETLCADFAGVCVAVRGVPFVTIPSSDASLQDLHRQLAETTDISPDDQVYLDLIDPGLSIAFALPVHFGHEAKTWYSGVKISHVISSLITYALEASQAGDDLQMHLNVHHGFMELVICKHGGLVFANHYRISSLPDLLYYTLAVAEMLEIQPADIDLLCSGTLAIDAVDLLRTYLPRVRLNQLSLGEESPDLADVSLSDLICVARCGS